MKVYLRLLPVLALSLLTLSCAQRETISYDTIERETFEQWISKYAPNARELIENAGLYYEIIEAAPAGAKDVETDSWLDLDYTITDLTGNVILNRKEEVAKKQGTYNDYAVYGPDFAYLPPTRSGSGMIPAQYEALTRMKVGETRRVYTTSLYGRGTYGIRNSVGYGGQNSSASTAGSQTPLIIDVTVLDMIKNPETREQKYVEDFASSAVALGGLGMSVADSVKDHLYMKLLKQRELPADTIKIDSVAHIYYIARVPMPDGTLKLFDTNIDSVWVNAYGRTRSATDSYNSTVSIDAVSRVEITRKEKETTSTSVPEKFLYKIIDKLHYNDSLRFVMTSRYAFTLSGHVGYKTTSSNRPASAYTDTRPYEDFDDGYLDYLYGASFYNALYSAYASSGALYPIPEVKPYSPMIYDVIVKRAPKPASDDDEDEDEEEGGGEGN